MTFTRTAQADPLLHRRCRDCHKADFFDTGTLHYEHEGRPVPGLCDDCLPLWLESHPDEGCPSCGALLCGCQDPEGFD